MTKIVHSVADVIAIFTIVTFWLSTALTEMFASRATVVVVKMAIPRGFLLLLPVLAAAGASGLALSKGRSGRLVNAKKRRLTFIVANGFLILIPSAMFPAARARAGEFDAPFYAVQVLELVAGLVNITLLGLNLWDGLKLKGKLRSLPPEASHLQ